MKTLRVVMIVFSVVFFNFNPAAVQAAVPTQNVPITAYKMPAYQISNSYLRDLATRLGLNPGDPWSVDHTYACVSGRGCYGVWGGSTSGGSQVVAGSGDPNRAICFAGCSPFIYGLTGVCHQHTNRVLYQSGVTLNSSVRGYSISVWRWGVTGNKSPWNIDSFQWCADSCGLRTTLVTN